MWQVMGPPYSFPLNAVLPPTHLQKAVSRLLRERCNFPTNSTISLFFSSHVLFFSTTVHTTYRNPSSPLNFSALTTHLTPTAMYSEAKFTSSLPTSYPILKYLTTSKLTYSVTLHTTHFNSNLGN
jgi:hypothetical protein